MSSISVIPEAAARADSSFAGAMSVPDAMLALREYLPPGQSRSRDLALNRSVVVLTVAAWQAWVETYVSTALTLRYASPNSGSGDAASARLLRSVGPLVDLAINEVKRFRVPNSGEVLHLFRLLGDDPRTRWSFSVTGGRRSSDDVIGRLDDWVNVRHAIAHGAPHLPAVGVLGRTKASHGSLTKRHAAQCVTFFRALVTATGDRD